MGKQKKFFTQLAFDREQKARKRKRWWLVGIIALVAMGGGITYWRIRHPAKPPADLDAKTQFAQCLTDKGAAMYGAYWCPHCQNQKKLFGDAFEKVTYHECTIEKKQCTDANIKGYPTWTFSDGSRVEGEMTLDGLSEKTGCPWGEPSPAPSPEPGASTTPTATSVSP